MQTRIFSQQHQEGFSLVELLVALLVSSIVTTALLTFFSMETVNLRAENARRAAQVTARGSLNFIVRELEHIGRDPRLSLFSSADPAIQAANENSLHYRANLSQDWTDTDISDSWEDVTLQYNADARTIEIVRGGVAVALTDDKDPDQQRSYVPADGLSFAYYDSNDATVAPGGGAAARASIHRIKITVKVQAVLPEGHEEESIALSQSVILRNVS